MRLRPPPVTAANRSFTRRADFDLAVYITQSFGVFQEKPVDVVLRVAPEAAGEARCWMFHPSQTLQLEPDGALLVRFRAGGVQEMCWHLFTWGTTMTVVAPDDLRRTLADMAAAAADHYGRAIGDRHHLAPLGA